MCKMIYTEFRQKIGIENSTVDDCIAYNRRWTASGCGYWRFVSFFLFEKSLLFLRVPIFRAQALLR